jgi:hypothetical protein
MTLIQTGSTLYRDGTSSGIHQLVYACDGCEAKTGDPYACIAFIVRTPTGEWDDSEAEGWTLRDGCSFCPDCVPKESPAQ